MGGIPCCRRRTPLAGRLALGAAWSWLAEGWALRLLLTAALAKMLSSVSRWPGSTASSLVVYTAKCFVEVVLFLHTNTAPGFFMQCDRCNTSTAAFSIGTNVYVTFHSGTNAASDIKSKINVQDMSEDDAINQLKNVNAKPYKKKDMTDN